MHQIKMVDNSRKKGEICNTILRALPKWFAVDASIVSYVKDTQAMPFWAAYKDDNPVGFVALKQHNQYTAEISVMGILIAYQRKGIGKELVACCEAYCAEKQMEFLTVKTLDKSAPSASYARTREFYSAMGFRPLEVFPLYWDKDNPCLYMAKYLPR